MILIFYVTIAECKAKIEKKLKDIGLTLNQKKTTIAPKDRVHGTPFKYLKWNFYLTTTNHVIQIPFKKKIVHQRRKLRKMATR